MKKLVLLFLSVFLVIGTVAALDEKQLYWAPNNGATSIVPNGTDWYTTLASWAGLRYEKPATKPTTFTITFSQALSQKDAEALFFECRYTDASKTGTDNNAIQATRVINADYKTITYTFDSKLTSDIYTAATYFKVYPNANVKLVNNTFTAKFDDTDAGDSTILNTYYWNGYGTFYKSGVITGLGDGIDVFASDFADTIKFENYAGIRIELGTAIEKKAMGAWWESDSYQSGTDTKGNATYSTESGQFFSGANTCGDDVVSIGTKTIFVPMPTCTTAGHTLKRIRFWGGDANYDVNSITLVPKTDADGVYEQMLPLYNGNFSDPTAFDNDTKTLSMDAGKEIGWDLFKPTDLSGYKYAKIVFEDGCTGTFSMRFQAAVNGTLRNIFRANTEITPSDLANKEYVLDLTESGAFGYDGNASGLNLSDYLSAVRRVDFYANTANTLKIKRILLSNGNPATVSRTTAKGSYGTICMPVPATVTGADLYTVSGKNTTNGTVYITPTGSASLTAGVSYVYKATADAQTFEGEGTGADAATSTVLNGTFETAAQEVPADNYVLHNNAWVKSTTGCLRKITSNHAYLNLSQVSTDYAGVGAGAAEMALDDSTTGVDEINAENENADKTYYNVGGQRVGTPTKGLYIQNGKTVVIK